ncbi:MAG: hypothetical protein L6R37_005654 [Teloschistes peruensis]|nr:MAG: hypothetical protein L6R37_005654 [Teloschistes peruensis]
MTTGTSSVDHDHDLLVITCASGKQATSLLPNLVKQWRRLRLVCHSPASEERLKEQYPDAEVIRTDLGLPKEPERILKDAAVIYHVEPPFAHRQAVMGFNMIDAARKAAKEGTFKHFVYASVLNTQLRKMIHHDQRLQVEEYLMESELNYTILQSTHFMFLFPVAPMLAQENPVYMANWNPDVPFSFLALSDLGEVGAKVLNEREKHYAAQYPLVSDGPLNYHQICSMVSQEIGKEIQLKQKSYEESVQGFLMRLFGSLDVDAESIDAVERILLYYNRHGLIGSSNVCEWLLGRKPTTWLDWMRQEIAQIKQNHQ